MILPRHPDCPDKPHKAIGYWNEDVNPRDFVDESWDENQRNTVVSYLEITLGLRHLRRKVLYRWRGSSYCRFCNQRNGSRCYTDGTYVWPSGFSHYLLEHGVKPPKEFIDHVMES